MHGSLKNYLARQGEVKIKKGGLIIMAGKKMTELQVKTKNEPGALAKVLGVVAEAGVNLLGFNCPPAGKVGTIYILPEDPAKASRALTKAGYKVARASVTYIESADKVGAGAEIVKKIAAKKINIDHAFATSGKAATFGLVVRTKRGTVEKLF